jgi:hypothetical protein
MVDRRLSYLSRSSLRAFHGAMLRYSESKKCHRDFLHGVRCHSVWYDTQHVIPDEDPDAGRGRRSPRGRGRRRESSLAGQARLCPQVSFWPSAVAGVTHRGRAAENSAREHLARAGHHFPALADVDVPHRMVAGHRYQWPQVGLPGARRGGRYRPACWRRLWQPEAGLQALSIVSPAIRRPWVGPVR